MHFMTITEAAEVMEVTPRTLLNYIKAGKLRAVKHGGKWLITDEDIKAYLNASASIPAAILPFDEFSELYNQLTDEDREDVKRRMIEMLQAYHNEGGES